MNNLKQQKKAAHKSFVWAVLVAGSAMVGVFFTTNSDLVARATFGGGAATNTTAAYIPNNYTGSPGDAGTVSVKVGTAGIPVAIKRLRAEFNYNENQIVFNENTLVAEMLNGTVMSGASSKTATISIPVAAPQKKLTIVITMPTAGVTVATGDVLFKLPLTIAQGAALGSVALDNTLFHVVAATSYAESDPTMSAGNIITVVAAAPVAPACAGAADWNCGAWSPATCTSGATQTRTCTALNGCTGTGGRPTISNQCPVVVVSNVTNCPSTVLGASHPKAHPNMLLKGPSGAWSLSNSAQTATGTSFALTGLAAGESDYTVALGTGNPCIFKVECYTSIDTANARNAIGSTDPAKLLLYDFDGDGDIGADDKLDIFNASKSCN